LRKVFVKTSDTDKDEPNFQQLIGNNIDAQHTASSQIIALGESYPVIS